MKIVKKRENIFIKLSLLISVLIPLSNIAGYHDLQSNSILNISLSKNSFKKFEPIITLLKYVNNNSTNDTIENMFSEYENDLDFKIIPLDGQHYRKDPPAYSLLMGPNPYIIKAKDTLLISRNINKFGIHLSANYFNMEGYFNPGRYKLFAKGRNKNSVFISDTLEFEVLDLNNEDSLILDLLTQKKYSEIIMNYPNNDFYEAVYSFYVSRSFEPKDEKFYGSRQDIFNLYKGFLNEFSESYYWYNPSFVIWMFGKFAGTSENITSEIQSFKNEYYGSALYKFIRQSEIERQIKQFHKRLRDDIKERSNSEK